MERLQKKGGSKIALYIILLIVAVGAMVGIRHCRQSSAEVAVGVDSMAVAIQYSPMSFFMDGDTLGGFDYTLLKLMKLPVKIYPITEPRQGLVGLEEGRYDMVIADLPQSAADSGKYLFTEPAYLDRQVLVQMVDSVGAKPEITSVLELDGDTVYVSKDSPMAERLRHIAREIGGEIHIEEIPITSEKLLLSQAIGEISGPVVVNQQIAKEMSADYPKMDYSLSISFSQFQPWVIRSGDEELLKKVNHLLDSVKSTPAYRQLSDRYL